MTLSAVSLPISNPVSVPRGAPAHGRPVVLIYRRHLLPYSETFIRNQAEALEGFSPFYVGLRPSPGLELAADRAWIANRGGAVGLLREARTTLLGPSRGDVERLRALQPRLLHAHFAADGVDALAWGRALGIPLVVTCHGYDVTCDDAFLARSRQGRRYLRQRADLWRETSLFLAVSSFIRERMIARGFPAEKLRVHHIGVALEGAHAVPREPVPRVLFAGRLTEKKGCAYLLRAMALVQKEMPEAELAVIGDGELRSQLEAQARATLTGCTFLGRQPPSAVKEWMQRATVFCVPSVTAANGDAEGFGMVFAEAQAGGLPVVSFASGGIPEAVAPGETGLLAPERDWRRLAEYLLLLLRDKKLWGEFSEAGRRRVARLFDLRKQTRKLEDIYREVLSGSTTEGAPSYRR